MADNNKPISEARRQQRLSKRIKALEREVEDLNILILSKQEAIASLIRARTNSIDKVRKSYAE